jgi:membrane-bound serine protease (ClpP class)
LVVLVAVLTAGFFMTVLAYALRAQRRPVEVGAEALVGREGEARTPLSPAGMVQVAGELWSAVLAPGLEPVPAGERVVVTAVEGLRLTVRPVSMQTG